MSLSPGSLQRKLRGGGRDGDYGPMTQVPLDLVEQTTKSALVRYGARDSVAAQVAHAVRTAEGRGNKICGLYYVESYCRQLETGRVDGMVEPVVERPRPGVVRVDGKGGFAQSAFRSGLDAATEAAKANGICGFSIEHTHTCTSLGYFTEQLASAGFLALGATNATPRVAPPGGRNRLLGTNPIAMSVPDGEGGVAFGFDFSTSAVALGKITMAAAAGESIPLGWAVDAEGEPTTDPAAALEGSLVSAGGYKGFGLGLLVELLAAGLTGGNRSVDVPPLKATEGLPHNLGQFYVVIDPGAYEVDAFYTLIDQLGEDVANDPGTRLPGSDPADPDRVEVGEDTWALIMSLAG